MQHFVRTLAYAAVAGVLVFVLPAGAAGPVRVPNGGMVLAPLPAPVDVVCGRGSGRSPLLTPVGPPPQNVHIESNGPLLHTLRWDRLPGITGYNIFLNNIATRNTWMLSNATPQLDEKYLDVSPRQSGAKYRVIALYPDGRQGCADFVYVNPPQLETPAGFSAAQTGPGKVHLSWQPVNLAKGYRLYGPGQPADGTFIPGTDITLPNVPDGSYSWQLTADYGGAWKGVDLPVASITLRTIPSGHYLVTVTGLRAVQINRTR